MLLPFEYKDLLVDQAHAAEVALILEELDFDLIIVPEDKYRNALLQRLKDLGEYRVYERVAEI